MNNDSWKIRRRLMFSVMGFCAFAIVWVLYAGVDSVVAQTTVTMSFATIISITGSYIFGAVWDDNNTRGSR